MKKLKEILWSLLGFLGASLWVGVWDVVSASDAPFWFAWPIGFILSFAPFTMMVVGFRRGFPEGLWGIK